MGNKYLVVFPLNEEERVLRPVEDGDFEDFDAAKAKAREMSNLPHCQGTPYMVVNIETRQILWLWLFGNVWQGFMDEFFLTDDEGRVIDKDEDNG